MYVGASPLNPQPRVAGEMRRLAEALIRSIESRPTAPARRTGVKRDARAVFRAASGVVDDYTARMRALDDDTTEVNFRHDGELGDMEAASAMRRIAGHVDALLIRRRKVLGWRTDRRGGEGRDILVAMLDHLLGEVRAWLESVLEVLDKPLPLPLRQAMPGGSEDCAPLFSPSSRSRPRSRNSMRGPTVTGWGQTGGTPSAQSLAPLRRFVPTTIRRTMRPRQRRPVGRVAAWERLSSSARWRTPSTGLTPITAWSRNPVSAERASKALSTPAPSC